MKMWASILTKKSEHLYHNSIKRYSKKTALKDTITEAGRTVTTTQLSSIRLAISRNSIVIQYQFPKGGIGDAERRRTSTLTNL
jgi:hydrogenase maturation factor